MIGGLDPFEGIDPFAVSRVPEDPLSRRHVVGLWLVVVVISAVIVGLIMFLALR